MIDSPSPDSPALGSPTPASAAPDPPQPDSSAAAAAPSARSARLREALRENLKRRKAQSRGRAARDPQFVAHDPEPAGSDATKDIVPP